MLSIASALLAPPAAAADAPDTPVVKAERFDLRNLRLLDGPFAAQQRTNLDYLLKLEPDRLLSWFRREAGLEPKAPPYRGWESEPPTLPGHILGFYMSGAAMMYQATGEPQLKSRLDYIIDQLAEVQDANQSGYLLPVANGKRLFAEIASGKIEIHGSPTYGFQINGVFEPTYTWNKITLGIYEVYQATGNEKARQVLVRAADWLGTEVLEKLNDTQVQTLLNCEHGSIHESFVDLYRLTRDPKYLKWARRLCHSRMLEPLAAGNGDFLTGYHANCSIPIYTGFECVYQVNGETKLHTAATNFLQEVIQRRSWVIGGNSADEHFFDPAQFERALRSPAGPETCNSVNMLRLIEAVYRTTPSPALMDHYERILWNHLLSAHDPERGMFAYYTPMQPGAYRVYSDEFDSMWCCVGTGLECPGKYAQMIYTRSPDQSTLDLNLFIASVLQWPEKHLSIRQETSFPDEAQTRLLVNANAPVRFALRVRHPGWITEGALKITVNGEAAGSETKPGEYAVIDRTWRDGDRVRIDLPMHLALSPLPHSDNYVALLYGPIVLSGALGTEGLTKYDFWQITSAVGRKTIAESKVPAFVCESPQDILTHLRPIAGKPLEFRSDGLARPSDVRLVPFYQNHFQRYAVYWRRMDAQEYQAQETRQREARAALEALEARSIDHVQIGNEASEYAHHFQGERSNTGAGAYSEHMGSQWRDAADGGWFGYQLKVGPARSQKLACTFWGQERGARTFDILLEGRLLRTVSLTDTGKADFYTVEIPIPSELCQGKTNVVVKFQAHPKNTAGGVFDLRMLAD